MYASTSFLAALHERSSMSPVSVGCGGRVGRVGVDRRLQGRCGWSGRAVGGRQLTRFDEGDHKRVARGAGGSGSGHFGGGIGGGGARGGEQGVLLLVALDAP